MIIYPLALPDTKSFKGLTMRRRNVVGVTEAPYSLKTQVQEFGGQRWEGEFSLPIMTEADAAQWLSFFDQLNGPVGTFLGNSPKRETARGAVRLAPNSLTVDGDGQTGQSLAVKSAEGDTEGLLLKGDTFQLGTGLSSRLYVIMEDVDLVDGAALLTFWPTLRASPVDDSAVIVQSAVGLWRMITTAPEGFQDEVGNVQISGIAIREA